MRNKILQFGLIGGAIVGGLMLLGLWLKVSGVSFAMSEVIGYTTMLLAFSMVFLGIRSVRDKELGGEISFGKGFKVGILITLIVCAIYVITWVVYMQIDGGDFVDAIFLEGMEEVRNSGLPASEIEKEIEGMNQILELYKNNIFVQIGFTLLEIFPLGLLVTLISAGILSRKKVETTKTDKAWN